eukprot:TRINITY_DN10697_c0_g1_i2.p1 TRINITY_DN10697_c0_g1~~TRINITY_DN10697_c0_g1_i2.p1  ORF type:complete len:138 (+),score=21.49 TRINITY_DN10697_c0_g1_i2:79-492(+)
MALREFPSTAINRQGAQDMAKLQQEALLADADCCTSEDLVAWAASVQPEMFLNLGPECQIILYLDSLHRDDSEFLTGFAVANTRSRILQSLYVHPSRWGQGVGTTLMRKVLPTVDSIANCPSSATTFFQKFGLKQVN